MLMASLFIFITGFSLILGIMEKMRHNPLRVKLEALDKELGFEVSLSGAGRGMSGLEALWQCKENMVEISVAARLAIIGACIGLLAGLCLEGITAALIGVLAFFVLTPRIYGKWVMVSRKRSILKRLPSSVAALLSSLRGGASVGGALEYSAIKSAEPIKSIFEQAVQEIAAGVKMEDAMERMSSRLFVPEGRMIGNTMVLYSMIGGGQSSLNMLESILQALRNREYARIAVRSQLADIMGDAKISISVAVSFFIMGFFLIPEIYYPFLMSAAGRIITEGSLIVIGLVYLWVRQQCLKVEEEI